MVGILAKISGMCAQYSVNVIEVSQSILQEMFCMIMLVDVSKCTIDFPELTKKLSDEGNKLGLSVHAMHEDIFNTMHHI